MADQQTEEKPGPRSFVVFFRELAGGEAEQRTSVEMQRLLERLHEEAVTVNGKVKGVLTIKVGFMVDEGGNAVIRYETRRAEPPSKTKTTHMFVDKHSRLTTKHPNQQEMWGEKKAQGVPGASKETNDIGTPAGPAQGV